jgi:hypothetical protein
VAELTDLQELEWLHDCTVTQIVLDVSSSGRRDLSILMRCPSDLGYERWNGRGLTLRARDIVELRYQLFGSVTAPETIDAVTPGISSTKSPAPLNRSDVLKFTVVFHSGSDMQIACNTIDVAVS